MKFELESQILAVNSKFNEAQNRVAQLDKNLIQEQNLKEEYHKSYKKAQFDLSLAQQKTLDDAKKLDKKLDTSVTEIDRLRRELQSCVSESSNLREECHRLKNAIVNKDSQNESLQKLLEKEKERREAETTELRRLFT